MKKSTITFITILNTILLTPVFAQAQDAGNKSETKPVSPFLTMDKSKMFKPIFATQMYATYSMDEKSGTEEYADQFSVMLRRFRFGASGNPYSWLSYTFQVHFDRIGENTFASTKGSYSGIGLWNAYITARLSKKSELVNLHAGYYWAAISRDYNTSPWAVSSFDKSRSTFYLRNFVTGTGNGITSGIGLGGIKNYDGWGIGYRVGAYEPAAYQNSVRTSLLYTGRLMFSFGDPEQKQYKYMLSGNQWMERKGVTLGFGASNVSGGYLNDTLFCTQSLAYGADLLVDYAGFRLDAEYFRMLRTAKELPDFNACQWHLRVSYNFVVANKYLEPSICFEHYDGDGSKALYKFTGTDDSIDFGLNWYLNKDKLKLAVHYMIQNGTTQTNIGDVLGVLLQVKL